MTLVKICGLTRLDDAREAVAGGADYLGFIFYPPSPRAITPDAAASLIRALRADAAFAARAAAGRPPRLVGVFVNESAETISRILDDCGLDFAQLSGDEALSILDPAQSPIAFRAYKAIRPRSLEEAVATAARLGPLPEADPDLPHLLLDTPHATLYGGTGQTADWRLASQATAAIPRLMLAGGLTPENVVEAIDQAKPFAVDVAGGTEASPGKKDYRRLHAFLAAARSVD